MHLLLIDVQKDFCFPEGSLYVAGRSGTGAIDDNRRIAEFIYRNLANLTRVTATMDTHFTYQIFSPAFWLDRSGAMLEAHRVITAVAVCRTDAPTPEAVCVESDVHLREASREEIETYVAGGEPMDKAGAYGIQGLGGALVSAITGSYSAVVGLPLAETLALLDAAGIAHTLSGGEP